MRFNRILVCFLTLILLAGSNLQPAAASQPALAGQWQYQEILDEDENRAVRTEEDEGMQGVLLSDLQTMPLHLLSRVFGKLNYSITLTDPNRFLIEIDVLGMHFTAHGDWAVKDDQISLRYDRITGFEALWFLSGFDHLTQCDADNPLLESVAYTVSESTLHLYAKGGTLVFFRSEP